jgi:AcrR family transcriptional regulator
MKSASRETFPPQPRPEARQHSRRQELLEAAASRFLRHGYAAASMRDIAADAGMRVGSIYYHFPSKADLLTAVHVEGLRRITESVTAAIASARARGAGPWDRLRAACESHMKVLHNGGEFYQAVMREMPRQSDSDWEHLVGLRDEYESIFSQLLTELPLTADINRHDLRLMLMGAMNYSPTWFRPGAESATSIAKNFVRFLEEPLDPAPPAPSGNGESAPRNGGRRSASGKPKHRKNYREKHAIHS